MTRLVKAAWILVLLVICLGAGCSPQGRDYIVVGMELAYPPFEMTDERGQPTGVSVDLAKALGQHLGREVEIRNVPFDGLIPSLQTRKIDLIISSMTATAERAQTIAFSDPYLRTGLCLLVGKDSPIQLIEDADKEGRVLAVKKGTTGHIFATDKIKTAKLLVLDKEDACVLEVVQGKADAFIYDQISVYENWRRHPDTTRALLVPFQEESWAIGLRKGNVELLSKVNEFLNQYKKAGGFETLAQRYLAEQKAAFTRMGYSFYF